MKSKTSLPSVLLFTLISFLFAQTASAGSATWNLNPVSGDWNTAANWTPATVPNGPSDTATFGASNMTAVSVSANTTLNGIVFNAGASAFAVTASPTFALTISGVGVANNSGITQNFATAANGTGSTSSILFTNSATAGSATFFTNGAGAFVQFEDTSTAGAGTFTNNGGDSSNPLGGATNFFGSSSAGNGTFTNNSSADTSAFGGSTIFHDSSTAASSTLIANTGSGGNNQGVIEFDDDSSGVAPRVEVFGQGYLDISAHNPGSVTIGSLEGDGSVLLGANNIAIGTNKILTTFAGVISGSGSVIMSGSTRLTFVNANTYLGGTIMNLGGIVANNARGSATGPGPVQVNKDTLGGRGTIAGTVTIGDGTVSTGPKPTLAPSVDSKHATLTIQSLLTFKRDGSYTYKLNTSSMVADQVIANGVTIEAGALFRLSQVANKRLPLGTVFTAISNTSTLPINGTFANLSDGSTLVAGRNNYQASYEGGDGNDLTLTVVQ